MKTPKAKTVIKPSLFEVVTEHTMHYIVAYDAAHAITSLINEWSGEKDVKSVKKLTDDLSKNLFVTKECLPNCNRYIRLQYQKGLVNQNK